MMNVKLVAAALAAALSVLAWSGCSAPAQPTNPYASAYQDAEQQTTSEYILAILRTGQVTTADIKDAEQHEVNCLRAAGIHASYETNEWGIDDLTIVGAQTSAQEAAQDQCWKDWMGLLMMLYVDQYTNPNNEDWNSLVAACLVRKGFVAAGFTGQDYEAFVEANSYHFDTSTMAPDENGDVTWSSTEPTGDFILPGGKSMSDPVAQGCAVVPLQ